MANDSASIHHRIHLSIVDVMGTDATQILNNLTTAEIKSLHPGQNTETFFTEVRGRTIGHGILIRTESGFRFVGAAGQSESIAAHIDRYTIREDAVATVRDDEFSAQIHKANESIANPNEVARCVQAVLFQTNWIGAATQIELFSIQDADQSGDPAVQLFHDRRIAAGYPWHGIDFDHTNLPQEVDRDAAAISFTKGCYLGQETVARLDAMGQVQKKLIKLVVLDGQLKVGDKILPSDQSMGGKPIARVTSIDSGGTEVLAMVRRVWFESTGPLSGRVESDGSTVVLKLP